MQPAVEALIKRCRSALFRLGWRHPFFLIPSQKISIRVDPSVRTACAEARGIVYFNPQFAATLDDDELTFVLAHELMHLLMLHFGRQGNRKVRRWNKSCDRVINFSLQKLGLKMPPIGLLPLDPAHHDYNAEEMYEVEPEQTGDNLIYIITDIPAPGAGCGPVESRGGENDDDVPGEGEAPEDGRFPTEGEASRSWRQAVAAAQTAARGAKDASADLTQIFQVPPSRVKWPQILRGACARAIAAHGRDDVSWSRRNRRSFDGDFILPGGVTYRAQIACAVDTSGSVSDTSLGQAVSEVLAISQAMEVKVFLVTHDAEVHFADWLGPKARRGVVEATMIGRGGTQFQPAYDAIERVGERFDHMVHLTDGEPWDAWPERPLNVRKLTVALIGCMSQHKIPESATVIEAEI